MVEEDKNSAPLGDVPSYHNGNGSCQGRRTKRCVCYVLSTWCAQSIIPNLNLETHSRFEVAEGTNVDLVKKYINRTATGICYRR